MTPKISIVTPSFNQGRYIRETIDSVLSQRYPNLEHIVVDGGSTDETVEILKSYPHLKWTSEKDRGQSHALNKGFAQVSGDIVAWLNSDDWYAEDIFSSVVDGLNKHPIVIGPCELRDENNQKMYVVPNPPRTWFDLLKYWIPYSIPAQPSIFMRKDFLELARRPDGDLFDEELHYCMDYDLWLRLCQHAPLALNLGRILSYYRMTGENKTGQKTEGMPYAESEMSRLFHRYKDAALSTSYPLSLVLPITERDSFQGALNSLSTQTLRVGEIILSAYNCGPAFMKSAREACSSFNLKAKAAGSDLFSRVTAQSYNSYADAINGSINIGSGSIVAVLDVSTGHYDNALTLDVLNTFALDSVGVADLSGYGASFAARKLCFVELDGLPHHNDPAKSVQQFIESCEKAGWKRATS